MSPCLIERARFTTWIHLSVWIIWIVNKNPLSLGNMVEKAVGLSFEASVNQRPEDDEIYRYIDFFLLIDTIQHLLLGYHTILPLTTSRLKHRHQFLKGLKMRAVFGI